MLERAGPVQNETEIFCLFSLSSSANLDSDDACDELDLHWIRSLVPYRRRASGSLSTSHSHFPRLLVGISSVVLRSSRVIAGLLPCCTSAALPSGARLDGLRMDEGSTGKCSPVPVRGGHRRPPHRRPLHRPPSGVGSEVRSTRFPRIKI